MPVKTAYTSGVFDLFHLGHLRLLERAAQCAERLIVGVSTDDLVVTYKGREPLVTFEERVAIIAALRFVDSVVPQTDLDKVKAWKALNFDVWVHGDDWKARPEAQRVVRELSNLGVECVFLPYTVGVSTTSRRESIDRNR